MSTILEPLNLYYKDINRKEGGGGGQSGHLPAELVLLRKVPNSIMLFKKICVTQFVFIALLRFSLVAASRGCSLLECMGFSMRWLLLLRITDSRTCGLQL